MRTHAPLAVAAAVFFVAGAGCTADKAGGVAGATAKGAHDCASTSLALPKDAVIGSFDGKNVTAGDLGDDLAAAERKAQFKYCDDIYTTRQIALENYVTEQLVKKAAAAAGQPEEEWMRAEVMKRVGTPTDAEIKEFYDTRKRPDAPPIEEVKEQVSMMIQRERSEGAVRKLVDELQKGAGYKASFPDVRSPPREVDVPSHTATKGKAGATVRVVEFADFECPYCSKAADNMRELAQKYGDRVEFAYRHFPLRSIHPNAQKAAEVSQCAKAQGKFWEVHDKIYAQQAAGASIDEAAVRNAAKELGVDDAKLAECLDSGRGAAEVDADVKKAEELGVEGTPTFFVNGRLHTGAPTAEGLAQAIDAAL